MPYALPLNQSVLCNYYIYIIRVEKREKNCRCQYSMDNNIKLVPLALGQEMPV